MRIELSSRKKQGVVYGYIVREYWMPELHVLHFFPVKGEIPKIAKHTHFNSSHYKPMGSPPGPFFLIFYSLTFM